MKLKKVDKQTSESVEIPGISIKQKRSQQTYETLIKTAFTLLQDRDLDSISIAELTHRAGYSVGAFYARFQSKDKFLDALVQHHIKRRRQTHVKLFSTYTGHVLMEKLIEDIVKYISRNRGFWITSLTRSVHDPDFWKPMRGLSREIGTIFIEKIHSEINRKLTEEEELNIRFAFQLTFGTINNQIINRPGPIQMNSRLFIEKLTRAFKLVSDYDNIIKKKAKRNKTGKSQLDKAKQVRA